MSNKIIGLCGFAGSGKSTVANILYEKDFIIDSFSKPLKDSVSHIFNWDRNLLDGETEFSRKWRETKDDWWSDILGIENFTPRKALQLVGTDCLRKKFHEDIWLLSLKHRLLKNKNKNFVITDCRFPNEIKALKNMGGKIILVNTDKKPLWFDKAKKYHEYKNQYGFDNETVKNIENELKNYYKVHESEWAWIDTDFDYEIYNDGSIDVLYHKVDRFLACI